MRNRSGFKVVFLALVAFILFFAGHASLAQQSPLQRLAERLQANRVSADHILLLDLSGSMQYEARPGSRRQAPEGKRRIDVLKSALPALLDAFVEGDYAVAMGFHAEVIEDPALVVSQWKGASSREALLAALSQRINFGGYTDLGFALEAAKKHVEREGHNQLQFVYFLTDGQHAAPLSHKYPSPDAPAWDRAAAGWKGLWESASHSLYAYLFGLYDVADPGVLRRALPQLSFLSFQGSGDLKSFFATEMSHALNRRVELLASLEKRLGGWSARVTNAPVELHDGKGEVTIELGSSFPHLDTSGELLVAPAGTGITPSSLSAMRVLLPSKGAQTVKMPVEAAFSTARGILSFRRCRTLDASLSLAWSNAGFEPSEDFNASGLAGVRPVDLGKRSVSFAVEQCEGFWPIWTLVFPILILAAAGVFAFRSWPRTVSGTLQWISVPRGREMPQDQHFSGSRKVEFGSDRLCAVRHELFPPRLARLSTQPKGLGTRLVLEVAASGVEVDGKPCNQGEMLSARGFCEIAHEGTIVRLKDLS